MILKLISILQKAGLTEGESKVFLALHETGLATIGPILEKSGVNKSVIYRILDRLMNKGIVSYIIKEKIKHYQAAPVSNLLAYIEEQEKSLLETKNQIEDEMPKLLKKLEDKKKSEAIIYQGFKGLITCFENLYNVLKRGEEYYFFGLPADQPAFHESYSQKDHKRRIKSGIRCKLLFNEGVSDTILRSRNKYRGCEARIMPFGINTPSWILVYENVTVIGIQISENPLAIEIVNEETAISFRKYFFEFWKRSRPFITK